MLRNLVYNLFVLTAALLTHQTNGQDCASGVDNCVNSAFSVIGANKDNVQVICKTTDEFFACVVEETKTCDPVVTASIKEGVSPMIEIYTKDPYNCTLENADAEELRTDPCSQQMNRCAVYYTQAETATDPNDACANFELYLDCMSIDMSECGESTITFIREHSDNATLKYDQSPYYCEERQKYDIDAVDANVANCYDKLANKDPNIVKQDYVCFKYKEFFTCTVNTLAKASPRQFEIYARQIEIDVTPYRTTPYFCDDDDPCMGLFESCNASASHPEIKPCKLLGVYTTCLTTSLRHCPEANFANVDSLVGRERTSTINLYNCVEENEGQTASSQTDGSKAIAATLPHVATVLIASIVVLAVK